jgi:tetratricopeptide (TPR) repeat protein
MEKLMLRTFFLFLLLSAVSFAQQQAPAPPPAPGSPEEFVQQGQLLSRAGKQDEALILYQKALDKSPNLFSAQLATGQALDLKGDYAQAREHLAKAIDVAGSDTKVQALRTMAVSYAFEGNAKKAEKYEKQVIDMAIAMSYWTNAAEICNELARIFLESGDPADAYKWYKQGYEASGRKSDMSDADKNLWLFRWESAQARVAARRGKAEEAQQHITTAKAALDKANNPDQAKFLPYLAGYVAFYTGDYKTAITELQKADQHDPLILALLGEAYEKSGDASQAKDYYGKVLEINTHNPTNAFARPLAKKKLAQ